MFTRSTRPLFNQVQCMTKRYAHKKAPIQIRLNQYIEGIGLKGQVVSVRPGLMRNVLYPSGKASYIVKGESLESVIDEAEAEAMTEQQQIEIQEQQLKQQVLTSELQQALSQVSSLRFTRAIVPGSEALFGSVSVDDILQELKDKHDIHTLEKQAIDVQGGKIKTLGNHTIPIHFADHTTVSISIDVVPEEK
ncbi:hypothetical protein DM01DRAFT_1379937 [Hesseltinella vesiculosa]|uniref:50S ribosomal protein L9, chloroplastic n=1 Tax=Hesseltinella vesiculosa TaxID=101127 RepID=A0A1X2GVP4_9FUNG|nr:hypothetical protein DM01DRAFT_1379937 [Hesseltinella vesiculosa]